MGFYFRSVVLFFLLINGKMFYGQDNTSFFGIRSGVSVPFGDFAKKSLDGGSFAQTGFMVAGEAAYFFKPHIGLGVSVDAHFHPVDVGLLGWEMVQNDPFLEDVYIRSDSYLTIASMIGPCLQYPLGKNLSLTAKIMLGLLYGQTPYQLYKPEYFGVEVPYYEVTSSIDYKFSWLAGAGLRYDVSPCFALVFDSEVMYDTFKFKFQTLTGTRIDETVFSIINLSMGIRLNL